MTQRCCTKLTTDSHQQLWVSPIRKTEKAPSVACCISSLVLIVKVQQTEVYLYLSQRQQFISHVSQHQLSLVVSAVSACSLLILDFNTMWSRTVFQSPHSGVLVMFKPTGQPLNSKCDSLCYCITVIDWIVIEHRIVMDLVHIPQMTT